MLIQLPVELWMEILDFLRGHRRELAAKFNQLGDRTFSEFCQTWLHKYTKNVRLGELFIGSEDMFDEDGKTKTCGLFTVYDRANRKVRVPIADVPLPENVTGFKEIIVNYLDAEVLNFLRRMMPVLRSKNSNNNNNMALMTNDENFGEPVELNDEEFEMMRTAIGHLLPLFSNGSLSSIYFHCYTANIFSSILDQFPDQLFSVKFLYFDDFLPIPIIPSIVRWLCTQRDDAEPRIAIFLADWTQLYEAIREQFLTTTNSPVSFFIKTHASPSSFEICHENSASGEQLSVRKVFGCDTTLIGRYPSGVDGDAWLREMYPKSHELEFGKLEFGQGFQGFTDRITLCRPQIGSMESDGEEEESDGEEEETMAEIPNKKRRL